MDINVDKTTTTLWDTLKEFVKNTLSIPNYNIFINSIQSMELKDSTLTLVVNNDYSKAWIKDKGESLIKEYFATIQQDIIIAYDVQPEDNTPQLELFTTDAIEMVEEAAAPQLSDQFTFDNFIVGGNNRFAHAASVAVANNPAKAYNPLFIYGSVGLGKTHLLHAMAYHIQKTNPSHKIMVTTSENFTNELINSLKNKQTAQFKANYRQIDVLIIDDIQFLAGKEATQEEFFHTFNELYSNTKQIILTSDRPPKDIPTLQDRLSTRFAWGLVADIQAPELETRIAILRKKIESSSVFISDEVLHYIATQIPSNVRELEGALTRIAAHASLLNSEITLSIASNVIKDMIGTQSEKPLTISHIKRTVSEYFSIPYDDLSSKQRTKELAYARQVAMYLARELTTISLPKIGENFGNRDHSTVMHACDKIKSLIDSDTVTRNSIESIISSIKNTP